MDLKPMNEDGKKQPQITHQPMQFQYSATALSLCPRYVAHKERSLYGFFQAGTNVLWHRERMTSADFMNNDLFVTQLLRYAFERQN